MLISLIGILVTLLLIIGIHEFGHFLMARLLGIKVLRFSIGFGKALWKRSDKTGTEYVIAAIPLGGYVKMLDIQEGEVAENEQHLAFNHQPFYKKCLVVIAGPLSNFILAFILYWILFMTGFTSVRPVTGNIIPHSIAARAGLPSNVEIMKVDNTPVTSWMGVMIRLLSRTGDTGLLTMEVKPLNKPTTKTYSLDLTDWQMDHLKPDPLDSLGIEPYEPTVLPPLKLKWPDALLRKNQYGPIEALSHAWQNVNNFTLLNLIIIGKLFTGKVSLQSLGGPISIFQTAGIALNNGITPFLSFLAFLSISIGMINVLPIPGLDGGHLLFQAIEAIMRRPISPKIIGLCYRIGFILLFLLIFQTMINDVLRLR
ncbi:MAG TPA: RIP metalloprotease RseP [Gammaproteobacteria bacterium]|nr:RIP metalloprotease RseP [Gammaproteobacteria bacterium]